MLTSTWSSRLRYAWNNTPHTAARACRAFVDAHRPLRGGVVSADDRGGPSIAYLGLPAGHLNVLRLLEAHRSRDTGGRSTVTEVPVRWADLRTGRYPDADLVLVGAERSVLRGLPDHRSITLPFRVHTVVHTDCDLPTARSRMSRRERRSFTASMREHDWKLEEDTTVESFERFYRTMYLPTLRGRHSADARIESYSAARHCILPRGRMFFLYSNGTRVAGMLCLRSADDRTLTTRLLGVAGGDDAHYASGAAKALYHLLIELAVGEPIDRLDLFGTEAFLAKGIFQFKRKLGATVVLPDNHFATKALRLVVNRPTAAAREFLCRNPVLRFGAGDRLEPVVFSDRGRPAGHDVGVTVPGLPDPVDLDLDELLAGP